MWEIGMPDLKSSTAFPAPRQASSFPHGEKLTEAARSVVDLLTSPSECRMPELDC